MVTVRSDMPAIGAGRGGPICTSEALGSRNRRWRKTWSRVVSPAVSPRPPWVSVDEAAKAATAEDASASSAAQIIAADFDSSFRVITALNHREAWGRAPAGAARGVERARGPGFSRQHGGPLGPALHSHACAITW